MRFQPQNDLFLDQNFKQLEALFDAYAGQVVLGSDEVTLTTTVVSDITSITVPLGSYWLWGVVHFDIANTTTITSLRASIHSASATMAGIDTGRANHHAIPFTSGGGAVSLLIPRTYVELTENSTYYLVAYAAFGVSTCKAFGSLFRTRIR